MAAKQLTLSRPLPRWWLASLFLTNAALVAGTWVGAYRGGDWEVLEWAARHAGTPELYTERWTQTYVWSPMGLNSWRVALIASALAMPTWTLRMVVLVSWPFWTDLTAGNLLTPTFLSAVYAWRGSRIGTAAFFGFALLIPRPLFVPMAVWLLWKRPEWRWPVAAMFAVHAVLVWWTGLGPEWVHTVLTAGTELQSLKLNFGPTRFLGYWWLIIGVPLGVWLFRRGHVGWAGLAISNYVWIYYLYWALPWVNSAGRSAESPSRDP
jgi:hypothetical protein